MKLLAPLLLAALVACNTADPSANLQSAQDELAAGSWDAAYSQVQEGLKAGAEGATAWRLELVGLEAQARAGKTAEATATLERLAGSHADQVKGSLYVQTATQLSEAGDPGGSIAVLDAGAKRMPGDPDLLKAIEQAKTGGDDAALEQLRSLGYLD